MRVLVTHFIFILCSNGSVKVLFKVIVEVLKPSKETNDVVAVKVGRKIYKQLKTGRIGNIAVVRDALKLNGNNIYPLGTGSESYPIQLHKISVTAFLGCETFIKLIFPEANVLN